jgi:hypothetical protein
MWSARNCTGTTSRERPPSAAIMGIKFGEIGPHQFAWRSNDRIDGMSRSGPTPASAHRVGARLWIRQSVRETTSSSWGRFRRKEPAASILDEHPSKRIADNCARLSRASTRCSTAQSAGDLRNSCSTAELCRRRSRIADAQGHQLCGLGQSLSIPCSGRSHNARIAHNCETYPQAYCCENAFRDQNDGGWAIGRATSSEQSPTPLSTAAMIAEFS